MISNCFLLTQNTDLSRSVLPQLTGSGSPKYSSSHVSQHVYDTKGRDLANCCFHQACTVAINTLCTFHHPHENTLIFLVSPALGTGMCAFPTVTTEGQLSPLVGDQA